ncbi:MAG: IS91 family transposase [Oscillospiraceae bacterium]|nr:IS91 family transposase [Oscillospiraceae bacterium]
MKTPSMTPHIPVIDPFRLQWSEEDLSPEDAETLLEQYFHADNGKRHILRDFFASHFPQYCESHPVPEEKLKIMNSLIACKSGKLGYTLIRCPDCGRIQMRACACGNRNCPSCGYLDEQRWVALRQAEVIPGIPYFHLVFTLPHDLAEIMYQNQRETLNLLFKSAKDTLLVLSQDKLKMTPGILMVLHTFGSNLSLHYHLHVLVSGGGLTADKKEFKRCLSNTFFLPVKAVDRLFKGKFMDGLKQLREDGKLSYFNDAERYRNSYTWKELLNTCYCAEWNVEIKYLTPVSSQQDHGDESTNNAITYFARYTNRTAISESRVESYDDHSIRFRYKDYEGSSYTWKSMDLEADEFIRRFMMHILPAGFTRIRSAGFMAGCVRKKNLKLIHSLLNSAYKESPVKTMKATELIRHFYQKDVTICEKCHGTLEIIPRMSRISAALMIRAA